MTRWWSDKELIHSVCTVKFAHRCSKGWGMKRKWDVFIGWEVVGKASSVPHLCSHTNSKVVVACHVNFGFLVVQDVKFCFSLNSIKWCTLLFTRSYVSFWNFSNLKDPREASTIWALISTYDYFKFQGEISLWPNYYPLISPVWAWGDYWAKIVEQRVIKNRVQYIHCG